ncbi:hypothetical protein SDC9_111780 [bioreactor metagenome]|uniref:Uncharacterized protein n=1 Tax=bioreactor metagenome TaxID=1076179 RepID=A0A645BHD7_9ZZZZ
MDLFFEKIGIDIRHSASVVLISYTAKRIVFTIGRFQFKTSHKVCQMRIVERMVVIGCGSEVVVYQFIVIRIVEAAFGQYYGWNGVRIFNILKQ